jgi:hypothetical protein
MADEIFGKHWRKNEQSSSVNTGKCAAWQSASDRKYKESDDRGGNNGLFDYWVCGNTATGCQGLTSDEWNKIWDNCKNNPDTHNYDTCFNSVTEADLSSAGQEFKAGCNTDRFNVKEGDWSDGSQLVAWTNGVYDEDKEREGSCTNGWGSPCCGFAGEGTCFSNDSCLDWWNNGLLGTMSYNKVETPAYPTTIAGTKIVALKDEAKFGTSRGAPMTCPGDLQGNRTFVCAGDGNSEDDYPGCGSGEEIDELEDGIRFCSRKPDDYDVTNLMECCLGDRGDPTKNEHTKCPVNFCRSSVPYTDALLTDTPCEEGEGTDMVCYEMSDQCNTMFEEVCTAELFNDPKEDINKQINCRKWTTIQPEKFKVFAEKICSIERILNIEEGKTIDDPEILEQIKRGINEKDIIVDLYNNELCRDFLLNSDDGKSKLKQICSLAIEKKEDVDGGTTWDETDFGVDMGELCRCYYPTEYYQWYKTSDILSEDEKRGIAGKIRPECFHMACANSGNYSTVGNDECPDIQMCIQTINKNSTPRGGRFGNVDRSSGGDSQSCNFNSINPAGGPTMAPDQGSGSGSGGSGGGSGGSGGSGSGSGGSGSGGSDADDDTQFGSSTADESGGMFTNPGGTSSTGDDNTMIILAGVMFCCSILVMIMMTMSGGGGGRGRGMSYGQPPMPYGMY